VLNRFNVLNDPVNFVDPLGLFSPFGGPGFINVRPNKLPSRSEKANNSQSSVSGHVGGFKSWKDFSRALSATGGPPPGVTAPPLLTAQEIKQLSKAMQNLVDNASNLIPGPKTVILPREFYEKMMDELMKGGEAGACTNK